MPTPSEAAFLAAAGALRDAHGLAHAVMKLAEDSDGRQGNLDVYSVLLSAVGGLASFLSLQLADMDRVEREMWAAGKSPARREG